MRTASLVAGVVVAAFANVNATAAAADQDPRLHLAATAEGRTVQAESGEAALVNENGTRSIGDAAHPLLLRRRLRVRPCWLVSLRSRAPLASIAGALTDDRDRRLTEFRDARGAGKEWKWRLPCHIRRKARRMTFAASFADGSDVEFVVGFRVADACRRSG